MKIVKIDKNIYQFIFIKESSDFPLNITVLIDGYKAILVDVAYEIYAKQVKKYLTDKGISEFVILISHHHEDHFDGCKSFLGSTTYASGLFKNDYQEHLNDDTFLRNYSPDKYLVDRESFKTKNFTINFIYTPGHNKCEFSFLINDKYLYVGDLIIYSKYSLPALPYIDNNSLISEYIESLLKIKSINPAYILLGHGQYLNDKNIIFNQIEERLFYLHKIQNSEGYISINDCLMDDSIKYSGLNFHSTNLEKRI